MANKFQRNECGPSSPPLRPQQPRRRTTGGSTERFARHAFSNSDTASDTDLNPYNPDRRGHTSRDTLSSDSFSNSKDAGDNAEEYSVFPKMQKRLLITSTAIAGSISGLSSNIYFPSQNAIAKACLHLYQGSVLRSQLQDLKVSIQQVNLTITSYLGIQGIASLI